MTGVWLVFAAMLVVLLWFLRSRAVLRRPTSIEPWVIKAFRKKKRQQWLMSVPLALFLIFLRSNYAHSPGGAGMENVLLLVLLAVAGLFTYHNWRCPKCDTYAGKYPMYSRVCPKCGTALREPTK